jgi:hypothetical protein
VAPLVVTAGSGLTHVPDTLIMGWFSFCHPPLPTGNKQHCTIHALSDTQAGHHVLQQRLQDSTLLLCCFGSLAVNDGTTCVEHGWMSLLVPLATVGIASWIGAWLLHEAHTSYCP